MTYVAWMNFYNSFSFYGKENFIRQRGKKIFFLCWGKEVSNAARNELFAHILDVQTK